MNILVADDVAVMRRLLKRALEGFGTVDAAHSGMQAITMIKTAFDRKTPYDVVCLDILMPDIDGIRVLKRLREIEADRGVDAEHRTKVMVISALSDMDLVKKAMKYGCDSYLRKPYSIEKAREEIRRLRLS